MPRRHRAYILIKNTGTSVSALFAGLLASENSSRTNQKRQRKLAVILLAVAIAASMLLTACEAAVTSTSNTGTTGSSVNNTDVTVRPEYLSSFMLAQRIAAAINQPNEVNNIYHSIPDRQRQDIMQDDFVQYVRLLRRMTNNSISLLTRISEQELKPLLSDLKYAADLNHEGFYFQSNPVPNGELAEPVDELTYFQQVAEDGTPYLDRLPITRVLSLQNYAALYFDAIDQGNREALAVLIRSSADSPAVRLEKADRILTFYESRVATGSSGFQVSMVMPDRISFEQQVFADETRSVLDTRSMTIYADGETGFIIDDKIPDTLLPDDLKISSNGQPVFDFSKIQNGTLQIVTSSLMGEVAGPQTLHDDTTCTKLSNGDSHMAASYNGISIEGIGRCDNHQFWRVQVRKLTINDPKYLTNSGLGIGQSLDTLLLKHPFLDDNAGVITGKVGGYNITMLFDIENKLVNRITLTIEGN